MEEARYPESFSLEDFAYTHVSEALRLAQKNLLTKDFYEQLYHRVSNKTGLTREAILKIHHAFHWTFFCDSPDSILEYIQTNNDGNRVRLKRTYFLADIQTIADEALENYCAYLQERIKPAEQVQKEIDLLYRERIKKLLHRAA